LSEMDMLKTEDKKGIRQKYVYRRKIVTGFNC